MLTQISAWKSKTSEKNAQIDLVIDRADHVINLCEVKYSMNPYTITKSYSENLRNKIGVFKAEMKTRKATFLTFITTHDLMKNKHAASLIQNEFMMLIYSQKNGNKFTF